MIVPKSVGLHSKTQGRPRMGVHKYALPLLKSHVKAETLSTTWLLLLLIWLWLSLRLFSAELSIRDQHLPFVMFVPEDADRYSTGLIIS